MMTRISMPLDRAELAALLGMATADCRHPREELRFILREEAQRRGLLPANSAPAQPQLAQPQPLEVSNAYLAGLIYTGVRLFSLFSATIDPPLLFLAAISQTIMSDYLLPALALVCLVGWSLLLSLIQQAVEQAVKEAAHKAALTQKARPERSRRAGSGRSRKGRRDSGNRRAGRGGKANRRANF